MSIEIAKWKTKGKDFLDLFNTYLEHPEKGQIYQYVGNGCGGCFFASTDQEAIEHMERSWGYPGGAGQATALRSDRPSLKRIK